MGPMTRLTALVLVGLLALAAVVGAQPRGRGGDALEELLFDLYLVPLDGRAPSPFTLKTLDGREVSLTSLRGQAVLIYYWATW